MSNLTFKIKEEKLCRTLIWFLKRWMVYFILSKTDSNTNLIFFPYLQLILVRFSSKLIGLMATSYRCPTCRSSNCITFLLCMGWQASTGTATTWSSKKSSGRFPTGSTRTCRRCLTWATSSLYPRTGLTSTTRSKTGSYSGKIVQMQTTMFDSKTVDLEKAVLANRGIP